MLSDYLPVLRASPFFAGFSDENILFVLNCFKAVERTSMRGDIIMHAHDNTHGKAVFIVEGNLDTVAEDFWGNENLLGRFHQGQVVGDAFTLAGRDMLPFNVVSARRSVVLIIEFDTMLKPCEKNCEHHQQLLLNLVPVFADKVVYLLEMLNFITQRTLREKLLAYLSTQALKAGSSQFDIELDRQELANFLVADRSALSSELSRMKKEGLITFQKNHFQLHRTEA